LAFTRTINDGGVVHDKETGKDTFMKMFSAGAGIMLGVKDFRGIFVFSTQEALDIYDTSQLVYFLMGLKLPLHINRLIDFLLL